MFSTNLAQQLVAFQLQLSTLKTLESGNTYIDFIQTLTKKIKDEEMDLNGNDIKSSLLNALSNLLFDPDYTTLIVKNFRSIIIELVARGYETIQQSQLSLSPLLTPVSITPRAGSPTIKRALDGSPIAVDEDFKNQLVTAVINEANTQNGSIIESNVAVYNFVITISKLIPVFSNLDSFLYNLFVNQNTFNNLFDSNDEDDRILELLISLLRLVRYSSKLALKIIKSDPLVNLCKTNNNIHIKYYSCSILSSYLVLSHNEKMELLNLYVSTDKSTILRLDLEAINILIKDNEIRNLIFDSQSDEDIKLQELIVDSSCFSKYTIDIAGYLFPLFNKQVYRNDKEDKSNNFITTNNYLKSLNHVAQGMTLDIPILLQGPPGCGKHSLFEEISRLYGVSDNVFRINLDQSTDSKTLLGTYVCSSKPGEFRWQDGILTLAVKRGSWILISNIDQAPLDVLAVVIPLIESRTLLIPQQGERIEAKDGFRIFATRISSPTGMITEMAAGEGIWQKVVLENPSIDELQEIVSNRYPNLVKISHKLIETFIGVKSLLEKSVSQETASTMRFLNMRDLFKFISRCDVIIALYGKSNVDYQDIDADIKEDIFRDACDCFSAMLSNYSFREYVDKSLGSYLDIPEHRVSFYCSSYSPTCAIESGSISVGRAILPIIHETEKGFDEEDIIEDKPFKSFAMTHNSQRLLESLLVSTRQEEPILLVGETGTGKTTTVSFLADVLGRELISINLSQQSESSDLLGGFKPVDANVEAVSLNKVFESIFIATFGMKRNKDFLKLYMTSFKARKWTQCVKAWKYAIKMANDVIKKQDESAPPSKKLKRRLEKYLTEGWPIFERNVLRFESMVQNPKKSFLFSFIEGSLIRAMKEGHWVLLDEINLASAETLECLVELLHSPTGSLTLIESGDYTPVRRHENFRLFACMNPANDSGKKNLPDNIRYRFTERWVDSPDKFESDLHEIVKKYLEGYLPPGNSGEMLTSNIGKLYIKIKSESDAFHLLDGADQRYRVSMRTLTRALIYAKGIAPVYGINRSVFEGISMSFATGLNSNSLEKVESWISELVGNGFNPKHIPQDPTIRNDDTFDNSYKSDYVLIGSYWLKLGPLAIPDNVDSTFITTKSVAKNLHALSRAVMTKRYPVLIQGPTSAGKTSIVEFLARKTGHKFVRINNHEHTDLQEYLGTWVSNDNGQLVFQHGVLVDALKNGYWIVLDELNLAPSDILEALNRLLDDNRELLIPETQEIIKPHKDFMLFATQNPAGLYGGRKQLSNAFRNRFLELHFGDIPQDELLTILSKRCAIAPSYATKVVEVFRTLQSRRNSRVFEGKQGFATLRDLFRWAGRECVGYEQLAWEGWCLIGEKMRSKEDRVMVKEVIEQTMRVELHIDETIDREFNELMEIVAEDMKVREITETVVWTRASKRLLVMVNKCLKYDEPVLLVGDTGAGKTTICQVLAELYKRQLLILNVHQNTEVSDFIGGQRPVRGRDALEDEFASLVDSVANVLNVTLTGDANIDADALVEAWNSDQTLIPQESIDRIKVLKGRLGALFTWVDGSLTQAMKLGEYFLIDEISLADDSVLERLNSVLEPSHLLVLAEKGGEKVEELRGHQNFRVLATMNPGGDYGKKELSPALRNRFTEIWVSSVTDREDLSQILSKKIKQSDYVKDSAHISSCILDFITWFKIRIKKEKEICFGMRDLLSWTEFINVGSLKLGSGNAFVHGGIMVAVDGIGVNPSFGLQFGNNTSEITKLRKECIDKLFQLAETFYPGLEKNLGKYVLESKADEKIFGYGPFTVECGDATTYGSPFAFNAPTTLSNAVRVLRAMQFKKPILLEGSPGVGKTSLISALSKNCKYELIRINLSEQTDLMDLFGSDLPVEGVGNAGKFAWRNGPFLHAMLEGHWVLLDELNLANQTVLEGLNACLDHRGEVYIPELDRTFTKSPNFRVFAAQNPQGQGGGRKGLPKSFVNRFTTVFVDALSYDDLKVINIMYLDRIKNITESELEHIIQFNQAISDACDKGRLGHHGGPWEFNLRDVSRLIELLDLHRSTGHMDISSCIYSLYVQRFRTQQDRDFVEKLAHQLIPEYKKPDVSFEIKSDVVRIGSSIIERNQAFNMNPMNCNYEVLKSQLPYLEALLNSVQMKSLGLLVGPSGSGKTSLIRMLAYMCGTQLSEFSLNPGIDSMELLGGFEQVNLNRKYEQLQSYVFELVKELEKYIIISGRTNRFITFTINALESSKQLTVEEFKNIIQNSISISTELEVLSKVASIIEHCSKSLVDYEEVSKVSVTGNFEWTDSVLLKAIINGEWLLLDNVNVCPSSVLDRLNGLLETNGVLTLNERGLVGDEIITLKPHKNFRIFMAMDPKYGEISRAMRNRSVEIYIPSILYTDKDLKPTLDLRILMASKGVPNDEVIESLSSIIKQEELDISKIINYNISLELVRRSIVNINESKSLISSPRSSPVFVSLKDILTNDITSDISLWSSLLSHFFATGDITDKKTLSSIISIWKTLPKKIKPEVAYTWLKYAVKSYNVDEVTESLLGSWLEIYDKIDIRKIDIAWANFENSFFLELCLKSVSSSVNKPTPLQQTCMVVLRLLDVDEMSLPGTSSLWNLLVSICEFVKEWTFDSFIFEFDSYAIASIVKHVNILINCMSSKDCLFEQISFSIKTIKASFENSSVRDNAVFEKVLIKLDENLEAMNWSYITGSNSTWARNGSVILHHRKLIDIDIIYRKINSKLEEKSIKEFANKELRSKIIEALATIYLLDSNFDDKNNDAIQLIETMSLVGSETLSKLEEELNDSEGLELTVDEQALKVVAYISNFSAALQFREIINKYLTCKDEDLEVQNVSEISDLLNFCLSNTTILPADLAPLQRLVWKLKNKSYLEIKEVVQDMLYCWHNILWKTPTKILKNKENESLTKDNLIDTLWYGFNSEAFLRVFEPMNEYSLSDIPAAKNITKCMLDYVKSSNYKVTNGLQEDILLLTFRLSELLCDVAGGEDHPIFPQIINLRTSFALRSEFNWDEMEILVNDFITSFLTSANQTFAIGLLKRLFIYLKSISVDSDFVYNHYAKGMSWLMLSSCTIILYMPIVPYDPAIEPMIEKQLNEVEIEEIDTEIKHRYTLDDIYYGIPQSNTISTLILKKATLIEKSKSIEKKLTVRPQKSQIVDIFNDLQSLNSVYFDSALLEQNISNISKSFEDSLKSPIDKSTFAGINSAVSRLESKYPLYKDILQRLYLPIREYEYALKICSSAISIKMSHADAVTTLLKRSLSMVQPNLHVETSSVSLLKDAFTSNTADYGEGAAYVKYLMGLLTKSVLELQLKSCSLYDLSLINPYFSDLFSVWESQERRRIEKINEENQSFIYKTKEVKILTAEERDKEEVESLFPTYFENFADIKTLTLNDDEDITPKQDLNIDSWNSTITNEISRSIVLLHKKVILAFLSSSESNDFKTRIIDSHLNLVNSVKSVVTLFDLHVDHDTDIIARASYMTLADYQMKSLKLDGEELAGIDGHYDFYRDPNPTEVCRILPVLKKLENKIDSILAEYPEQEILIQMRTLCHRLLGFKASSSVMQFLAGIEILLLKSPDWEKYAASKVSLSENMKEITSYILRWRKLELECWRNLLKVQEVRCEEKTSNLWFHLWSILLGEIKDDSLYVNLLEQIIEFVKSSSVGQFEARIEMLKTFSDHIKLISLNNPEFVKRSHLISNIYSFFSVFIPTIQKKKEDMRKPIEKELKEFVKIAVWKDVNVFAIQESARKTHYHLHKFIKNYSETLNESVNPVIENAIQQITPPASPKSTKTILPKCNTTIMISSNNIDMNISNFEHRMRRFTQQIVSGDSMKYVIDEISGISLEALATIYEYKQLNNSISGNASSVKNQRAVRKKSLVTCMKRLSSLGLSAFALSRFNKLLELSRIFVLSSNSIDNSLESIYDDGFLREKIASNIKTSDKYYWKSFSRYNLMKAAADKLNEDISSNELSRMLSYSGDLINKVAENRSHLSEGCFNWINMFTFEEQFKLISQNKDSLIVPYYQLVELYNLASKVDTLLFESKIIAEQCEATTYSLVSGLCNSSSELKTLIKDLLIDENKVISSNLKDVVVSENILVSLFNKLISLISDSEIQINGLHSSDFFVDTIRILKECHISAKTLESSINDSKVNVLESKVESMDEQLKPIVDAILISFQKVKSISDFVEQFNYDLNENNEDSNATSLKLVSEMQLKIKEFLSGSGIKNINTLLLQFINGLRTNKFNKSHIIGISQLLSQLIISYRFIHSRVIIYCRELAKFTYIMVNTFLSIIQVGYNLPSEAPDNEDCEDNAQDAGGIGIGEGQGKQDVSDQIEDESQIEGLKGDQPDQTQEENKPEQPKDEEDTAIETEMDFDGLEDMDQGDDDEDDKPDENDEKDPNEEMGDLDGQGDVVDEKMWDESDEESETGEENKDDGKIEKDSGMNNTKDDELEMAAGQEEEENDDKQDNQNKNDEKQDEASEDKPKNKEEVSDENEDEGKENNQDEAYEENHDIDVKEQPKIDDADEEGNDNEPEDEEEEGEKVPSDVEDAEKEEESTEIEESDKTIDKEQNDGAEPEGEEESDEMNIDDGNALDNNEDGIDEDPKEGDDENANGLAEKDESEPMEEDKEEEEIEEDKTENTTTVKDEKQEPIIDEMGVEDNDGNAAMENDNAEKDFANGDEQEQSDDMLGGQQRNTEGGKGSSDGSNENQDPDPLRSLGDSLKKWTKRLENISEANDNDENQPPPKDEEMDQNGDYEFVHDDNEDYNQALADATVEQSGNVDMDNEMSDNEDDNVNVAKLEEKEELNEEKEESSDKPHTKSKNNDEEKHMGLPENIDNSKEKQEEKTLQDHIKNSSNEKEEDEESIINEEENEEEKYNHYEDMDISNEDIEKQHEPLSTKDYEELRKELDLKLSEYRELENGTVCRELWEDFVAITRDEAFSLCEQLRLILEPTLATKLKGDFRTGKRLNMRKIIPYVASQFKKDKIWLRRKKPSKRTYQIMLCVDDSKSMSESQSVKLAFESLATITTAMTQLEVGQCSVVSFGETVNLLHPFEKPFDHSSGADVLRSFTFNQDVTNVGLMVDTCVNILEHSRHSLSTTGSSELWQLQIIISDGICEDHAKLNAMVKEAAEKRIMMVFVVLDNRPESESISKMTNVSYITDSSGRPKVNINRYMDTFPFDYYTIVRDISTLPSVLSETLRQFFMQSN